MSRFKTVIVAIAIVAFLGYCVWLSPNLFGNRIRSEMVACSLLKYDRGAAVYLASRDDNSKVFFGQSGKYRFFGTGALTIKAWLSIGDSNFGSGFNLLIEGGDLEIKAGQADILTGSVSPSGQFLALMSVDGILSIHEISTGKATFRSAEPYPITVNLFNKGGIAYPGFFWTDQGLVVEKDKETKLGDLEELFSGLFEDGKKVPEESVENPTDSEAEILGTYDMATRTWIDYNTGKTYKTPTLSPKLLSIEPSKGNVNDIPNENPEKICINIIGTIDSENLLILFAPIHKDSSLPQIGKMNVSTSEISGFDNLNTNHLGYHNNKLFYIKDGTLVYSNISAKSASEPVAVTLPELDGEKLTPELVENLRITSRGYFHFRHIKTAKTYLLEPVSGIYVEIPKERYPY